MLEILKLILDGATLRDVYRKGMLSPRVWLAAIAFLVVLYGVGLPEGVYYANHPRNKPAPRMDKDSRVQRGNGSQSVQLSCLSTE